MMKSIMFVTVGDIKNIATMKRALGMANPLKKLGWKVYILAEETPNNRERIDLECDKDILILFYKKGNAISEVIRKTRFVNMISPDFIYICSFSLRNFIIKIPLLKFPKTIIEHSELASEIQDASVFRRFYIKFMEKFSVSYADYLVAASKFLLNYYKSSVININNIPVQYSPYAFNGDVLRNINENKLLDLQIKYGAKKTIIYLGSFTKNYGFYTMLEAAKILKNENENNFTLLLIGKGSELQPGLRYVEENKLGKIVEILGYVEEENLSSYFSIADAFISPLNDTIQDIARCPSKIYMYMPFNKPILTSKIGEPFEIFGEDGNYFDTNNPSTLALLVKKVIYNKISRVSIEVQNHSWTKRAEDFSNWIETV